MNAAHHLTKEQLETGLDEILRSPKNEGALKLIVCRPETERREILSQAHIDSALGLVGDNWKTRGSKRTPDGSANPEAQVTIMNSRVIALVANEAERWQLAGDQLFVDLDLSIGNLPSGTRLALGSAVLEVSAYPHTGCSKFQSRFGDAAMKFVNSEQGQQLRLRGMNAKIVAPDSFKTGDVMRKVSHAHTHSDSAQGSGTASP